MKPEKLLVKDHKKDKIDLSHLQILPTPIRETRITEIHHKENGTTDEKPSFAFVSVVPGEGFYCSQISLNTLEHALNDLGYKIIKKQD